jgi:hypothetical protein
MRSCRSATDAHGNAAQYAACVTSAFAGWVSMRPTRNLACARRAEHDQGPADTFLHAATAASSAEDMERLAISREAIAHSEYLLARLKRDGK